MKNVLNRKKAVRGVLLVITVGWIAANGPVVLASASVTSYSWQFGTSANPASPDSATGGVGTAVATLTPGQFSDGWLAGNSVFGNANGIWNLGLNGTITLTDTSGLIGAGSPAATISVHVVQYNDGGIYSGYTAVSIPGAQLVSTNITVASGLTSGPIGGWISEETVWSVSSGTAVTSIAIDGATPNGSVIDSVSMQATPNVVTAPPQLTIQGPVDGQVTISWSSAYSSMVLESNSDLNNSQGWTAVQATIQVNGTIVSVTVPAGQGTQFYRLKQP